MNDVLKLLIELSGLTISVGFMLWRLSSALTKFELIGMQQSREISEMKEVLRNVSTLIVDMARQTTRLDSQGDRINRHDQEIADLRRGRGFIQEDLDGEYGREGKRRGGGGAGGTG